MKFYQFEYDDGKVVTLDKVPTGVLKEILYEISRGNFEFDDEPKEDYVEQVSILLVARSLGL